MNREFKLFLTYATLVYYTRLLGCGQPLFTVSVLHFAHCDYGMDLNTLRADITPG